MVVFKSSTAKSNSIFDTKSKDLLLKTLTDLPNRGKRISKSNFRIIKKKQQSTALMRNTNYVSFIKPPQDKKKKVFKKKWIHPAKRHALTCINPDKRRYYAFVRRKITNTFFTVTDSKGQVIASQSAGSCKITTKKKKRSPETVKSIASSISKLVRSKNIRYIDAFYTTRVRLRPVTTTIFDRFKQSGLEILRLRVVRCRPHSHKMRKKKSKRL